MSGIDGHSMTNIEDGGGTDDGAQDSAASQDNDAQSQPSNAAGAQRRAADPEAGAAGGEDEGEIPGEGEGAEAEPEVELDENGNPIEAMEAEAEGQFDPKAFEEGLLKKIDERMKPPPAPPQEMTEEQWAAKEQEFGVPRTAIHRFTNMMVEVHNRLNDQMEARFAKFEKGEALRTLSRTKGFEDAQRYPKGIETFLSKYDPKYHAHPELLKQAVIYARGLAATPNISRVRTERERNRRIVSTARPSSPGSAAGATRKPGAPSFRPLRPDQRQVMEKFNMTEKEYRNLQGKSRQPVVDAPAR